MAAHMIWPMTGWPIPLPPGRRLPLAAAIYGMALAIPAPVWAASIAVLPCPPAIALRQGVPAPPGWTVFTRPAPHLWVDVSFVGGKLADQGVLIGDVLVVQGDRQTAVWDFTQIDPIDTIWMGCDYSHTGLVLYQRLDPHIRRCRVSYSYPAGQVLGVTCSAL